MGRHSTSLSPHHSTINRLSMNDGLEAYAQEVRRRIEECDCEVFRNRSAEHAAIILREFIDSATASVRIFCGHLSKEVYGNLLPYFRRAHRRGVEVQVVTASDQIDAIEVAEGLREKQALRSFSNADTSSLRELPHFAIVDGKRYRLETNPVEKSALVCAYAMLESQKARANLLDEAFSHIWEATAMPKV